MSSGGLQPAPENAPPSLTQLPDAMIDPLARDLHANVSSAAVEIYAGGVGLSQGLWLLYLLSTLL